MRTYTAQYHRTGYSTAYTVNVAALSFLEAWMKVKRLMRASRGKCTLLSIVQTAKLDA